MRWDFICSLCLRLGNDQKVRPLPAPVDSPAMSKAATGKGLVFSLIKVKGTKQGAKVNPKAAKAFYPSSCLAGTTRIWICMVVDFVLIFRQASAQMPQTGANVPGGGTCAAERAATPRTPKRITTKGNDGMTASVH